MPKWKENKKTENKGVIKLKDIVNENGCIYREVPGDTDTGIDGFIEFVDSENVTGQLIAVQVKTGDSYYNATKGEFELQIDDDKLNYWKNYMLPVIIFFYSPSIKKGAWISIKDYIEYEEYHDRLPITKIKVSINSHELKYDNFSEIRNFTKMNFDSKLLFTCVDNCFSTNEQTVIDNFFILSNHPYSKNMKIIIHIAMCLLKYTNTDLLKEILFILGYGIGRGRWSWNPNNKNELDIINYSYDLCSELTKDELYKLLCVIDDEGFHGPTALGERYFDVISCCPDTALPLLDNVAKNNLEPFQRRLNALYLNCECDDEIIEDIYKENAYDNEMSDLFSYIFKNEK